MLTKFYAIIKVPSPSTVVKLPVRNVATHSHERIMATQHAPWKFSCMCGERVVQEDPPHLHPKGLVFECSQVRAP